MARISTHVLDIAKGRPAAGIAVELRFSGRTLHRAVTNSDGRTDEPLWVASALETGQYDLIFSVGDYFRAQAEEAFFDYITLSFVVRDAASSYHVPLLLAPHGYSTYRGS